MEKQTGDCKHGVFMLRDGCPECIAERQNHCGAPRIEPMRLQADPNAWRTGEEEVRVEPITAVVDIAPGQDVAVQKLLDEVMKVREYADTRVIATQEDAKLATDDLSLMAGLKKSIEEKRKQYVGPLQEHVKTVNDAFKFLTEPLAMADKTTRDKVTAYQLEQQRIQEKQEEINRKRMEAARDEMELKGELTESVDLVEVKEAPKLTRAALGTTGMAANWKWRVIDADAIPREYLVPDEAMLNSIAKKHHDQKPVAGIEFFNEPGIRVYKSR